MILDWHEYAHIHALASEITLLCKQGMTHGETIPVNDHIHFMDSINRATHNIRDTIERRATS